MSPGDLLAWLLPLGFLGWAAVYTLRNARAFAASPLAGPRMRRVADLYVPLLLGGFALTLAGLAVAARSRGGGPEAAISGGAPLALMTLLVVLAPLAGVVVAAQGFTLSERLKRRGDVEAATRLRTRGFFALLTGGLTLFIGIFAGLLLATSA